MVYKAMWEELKRQLEEIRLREEADTLEDIGCISGEILWRMQELEQGRTHSLEDNNEIKTICPSCFEFSAVSTRGAFVEVGQYDEERGRYEEEAYVNQHQCESTMCGAVFYK